MYWGCLKKGLGQELRLVKDLDLDLSSSSDDFRLNLVLLMEGGREFRVKSSPAVSIPRSFQLFPLFV